MDGRTKFSNDLEARLRHVGTAEHELLDFSWRQIDHVLEVVLCKALREIESAFGKNSARRAARP